MNIETLLLKNTMHTISKLFKIFFENIKLSSWDSIHWLTTISWVKYAEACSMLNTNA